MKQRLIIFLLLAAFSFKGYAQEDSTLNLSLKDAQQYALDNNLSLKNAKLDIQSAEKKVWETTAIGLPQVNGNVSYQYIPGDIPTASFGDSSTLMLYQMIFDELTALGSPTTFPTLQAGEPFELGTKNSTTYGVTVSQLVFSGEYIVGLQASKTYLKISELSHEKQVLDLKSNVLLSYASILILENNLEIINSSLKNMESLVNETKKFNEQGFLEATDVDQLQITLNTLINSKSSIKRQIDISYMLFKILLGTNLQTELVLNQDITAIYSEIVGKDLNEGFDLTNNIDYKMMDNQVKISHLSFKREKTKYLPTISAYYNYQDKTNKASFDFTINHIIGVNLDMPIFSSFQRNAVVQQAKIEYQKSKNNMELLEQNLNTQEQQLRYNYLNALDKYSITNQNIELTKNVFNNTTKKYKLGMASSMDLTQANNAYLQAESENTSALYELIQTKIELEKILNEL